MNVYRAGYWILVVPLFLLFAAMALFVAVALGAIGIEIWRRSDWWAAVIPLGLVCAGGLLMFVWTTAISWFDRKASEGRPS